MQKDVVSFKQNGALHETEQNVAEMVAEKWNRNFFVAPTALCEVGTQPMKPPIPHPSLGE